MSVDRTCAVAAKPFSSLCGLQSPTGSFSRELNTCRCAASAARSLISDSNAKIRRSIPSTSACVPPMKVIMRRSGTGRRGKAAAAAAKEEKEQSVQPHRAHVMRKAQGRVRHSSSTQQNKEMFQPNPILKYLKTVLYRQSHREYTRLSSGNTT
jgi:hypothetical protein